jgi:UDP-N-acetylglucosamine--N-acetylmuramyl-(pentapeptide) pyrophosphoryl-undecaprenol N-acetylglucosamine transferase
VADALVALADVEVIFCGTARGIEKDVVPARGYRLELLEVSPMKGGGAKRALGGAFTAAKATLRALRLVRAIDPAVVLSVGGYAAGPVALAAALARVPIAVFEPNGVLGLTNRLLAPFAKRAYVTWPEVAARFGPSVRREIGVPLRQGFEPHPYQVGTKRRLLVMGGSLGAQAINERMPAVAAALATAVPGLEIVHQTGRGNDGAVRAAYEGLGVAADVRPFLDDVPGALRAADLILARSGAGTVAEIAAVGRAAVFVPFPFAADDHQTKNARAMERAGGAIVVSQGDATVERLTRALGELLQDDARRVTMAGAAASIGRPHAAWDAAGDMLTLGGLAFRVAGEKNGKNGSKSGAGPSRLEIN